MRHILLVRRPLAFSLIAVMLFTISASGCSSTQRIDTDQPDASYREFEEKLADKDVKVLLGEGTTQKAQNLKLNADSTTWTSDDTGEELSIATSDVWRLQTNSGAKGAGQGLLIGLLAGASFGALTGFASGGDDWFSAEESAAVGAVAFGLIGSLLGLIIGSSVGSTTTYEINPELAPAPPAQRGNRYRQ